MGARAWLRVKGVNNLSINQCGIAELLGTWIMLAELYRAISSFLCFKTSRQLRLLFRKILQRCLAVKLQKCFMDYETTSFPSTWWWVDNGWIFHLFPLSFRSQNERDVGNSCVTLPCLMGPKPSKITLFGIWTLKFGLMKPLCYCADNARSLTLC